MNKLNKLIHELCPAGVDMSPIGKVVHFEQPTKYIVKSTNYDNSFPIPVLTAGQSFILGYTNEQTGHYIATKERPVIIFDDFTGAFKWVDFTFKVKSSAMKILAANEDKVLLRYIFHVMGYLGFSSAEHKRLWIGTYSEFEIPIPPLAVQEEIVRILDKFTELEAELEAELEKEQEARKKQYEWYRDRLLSFDEGVKRVKIKSIAEVGTGSSNGNEAEVNGKYPFYIRSQTIKQKNKYEFDEEAIIIPGEGGIGDIFHYINGKYALHQRAYRIHFTHPEISARFVFYYMKANFKKFIMGKAVSATVSSIRKPMIEDFEISMPPIEEQRRIVSILDRLDTLCNDISTGLPAEIAARRKQYEYYRDKLLSFEEVA